MKNKIFFIVMGLLALFVVIYLIDIRKSSITRVDKKSTMIDQKLDQKKREKLILEQKKKNMETELGLIPETILNGFEDPERQFVDFMDYINSSNLSKLNGSVAISQMQTFKERPVPLQETKFEFELDIKSMEQLEQFLDYLFIKGKYPLNVERIEVKRIPKKYPHVSIAVALLLPAKIDLPQKKEVRESSL